jgi:N-acetyl-gamma-glutamyl-phosphate reductase
VGVLRATKYIGTETVCLLTTHPYFKITLMNVDRKVGQSLGSFFPHLITEDLPDMVSIKDAYFSKVDVVFFFATWNHIGNSLLTSMILKVVYLSVDFQLHDTSQYEEWYNQPHRAPNL